MGSKGISRIIIIFFLSVIVSCSGNKGRPASGFEGPGPLAIAPKIINGEGELLFAGGITSHWIYGVNLIDFYPFDINGNTEGNRIDNLSIIDVLTAGIDGRFLIAGGDSIIKIYDILRPETPSQFSVDGWITSLVSDPNDPDLFYATSWNGTDGNLYKLKVNSDSDAIIVEPTLINLPSMLPVKILLSPDIIKGSPPLLYLLFKDPPSIKAINYSDLSSGFISQISFSKRPEYAVPVLGGTAFYIVFEDSQLSKFTSDGVEIVQTEVQGIAELPRILESVPMNIALLPPTSVNPEMVIIPDGKGYVDLIDTTTGCPIVNTSYRYLGLTDTGEKSNPSLEEVTLSSCNTKTEDWTISYHGIVLESNINSGKVFSGQDIFVDENQNFIDLKINAGDILTIISTEFAGDYQILEVIDQNTLMVDRIFTADETSVVYNIKGVPYLVKGSVSGVQKNRGYENETYISDNGELSFKIVPKENPVTEGDTFYLSTEANRIKLEGLPYGVAIDSSNLIYISNYGSNSISVIDPAQLKVIDTLR